MATGLFPRKTLKTFLVAALLLTFAGWVSALQPPLDEDWISSTRAEMEARLGDQDLEATTEALMARPSVVPIFFVPTDWAVSSAEVQKEVAALRTAMAEIQDFYGDQLGYTFRLEPLAVVQAWGRKEAYDITWTPGGNIYTNGIVIGNSFEGSVVGELYSRGYPTPPGQNEDGRSALIFVKGAGGWAGGREFPSANGGWAILGDWCIDSIAGDVPEGAYWWSGRRLQIGAAAHELGHTFGLPHPPSNPEYLIMGNWWQYPDAGFSSSDRAQLAGPEKKVFFVARSAGFDYDMGDITTATRQLSVYPGGEWIQSRNLSGSTWGPWQWTRVSTVGIPGLTAIRSFSQGIRPTDGVPKQDFVDSTGNYLYSRGFVGGVWQPASVLSVSQLLIPGVTRLWGFEQSGGTFGDPIKQVAIPFDGKGFYTRVFSGGTWGGWSYTPLSSFLPSLAAMRSFSEARISSNTIQQDVLSTDHATRYTRTKVDGYNWSGWTATPVINLEMPIL